MKQLKKYIQTDLDKTEKVRSTMFIKFLCNFIFIF
jgi:hypothetical protein